MPEWRGNARRQILRGTNSFREGKLKFWRCNDRNRPEQTRFLKGIIFRELTPVDESESARGTWFPVQEPFGPRFYSSVLIAVAVFRKKFIADHPSGMVEPSPQDKDATAKLSAAGRLLNLL